eukprot:CAMPEP_0117434172 /NCGR_PEP_ID=MMETSP0758-20121206/13442_1 /TAXON_ID=63605 /ORGANISM="Percolomonas cosmopolitus, Strain AE-1 (ATCC 50343)" /LENGTH=1206 /DNA_ID=CAMNT_0005225387 /DNA_START=197 /DNA_END=3817 /DNA_ORIENTATION=+
MYIWNISDGRCMSYLTALLPGVPSSLVTLPGSGNLVACSGEHDNIEIIDIQKGGFSIIRSLKGHNNSIVSMSSGSLSNCAVLLSISKNNVLRYWTFHSRNNESNPDQLPDLKIDLDIGESTAVSKVFHSPDFKYVIVIHRKKTIILKYRSSEIFHTIDKCYQNGAFLSDNVVLLHDKCGAVDIYQLPECGDKPFIDVNNDLKIMEQKKRKRKRRERLDKIRPGSVKIEPHAPSSSGHEMPIPTPSPTVVDVPDQETSSFTSFFNQKLLGIFSRSPTVQKETTKPIPSKPSTAALPPTTTPPKAIDTTKASSSTSPPKPTIVLENPEGDVHLESSSSDSDSEEEELLSSPNNEQGIPLNTPPITPFFNSPTKKDENVFESTSASCVSLIFSFNFVSHKIKRKQNFYVSVKDDTLIVGYMDGHFDIYKFSLHPTIEFTKLNHCSLESGWPSNFNKNQDARITASKYQVDRDHLPQLYQGYENGNLGIYDGNTEVLLQQAHQGSITSIIAMKVNKKPVLISAGRDAKVNCWSLSSKTLIKSFHLHVGPIQSLFVPPNEIRKKLNNCFCSVGEDRSLILYSLRKMEPIYIFSGHSSPILHVFWRPDYVFVRCVDNSIYVWQLLTGILERRIVGKRAFDIIHHHGQETIIQNSSMKFSMVEDHQKDRGFLDTLSLDVSEKDPSIQLVILSVRRLIQYIRSNTDTIRSNIRKGENAEPNALNASLGFLLQYGNSNTLKLLRHTLRIKNKCYPKGFIGLKGAGNTYSLIVPKASRKSHPFKFSAVLTATHKISCIAVLNALSNIPELQLMCNEAKQYILFELPDEFEIYENPSFLYCAQFLRVPVSHVRQAARSVMDAVLHRMTEEEIEQLAEKLCKSLAQESSVKEQNFVIALGVLVCGQQRLFASDTSQIPMITVKGLMDIMSYENNHRCTALRLLGEAYSVWHHYIPDAAGFFQKMFELARPKLLAPADTPVEEAEDEAHRSLVLMANVDPKRYMDLISSYLNMPQQSSFDDLKACIRSLWAVIREFPACLCDHLIPISSLLVKVLDPHYINIRNTLFSHTKRILRVMVGSYPMVSFNQSKQRFAVGNKLGMIVVYDLQTASKYSLIDGHRELVTALSINLAGDYLASYSCKDSKVKIWNIEPSGMMNLKQVLGGKPRPTKTFEIPQSDWSMDIETILNEIRLMWESKSSVVLYTSSTPTKTSKFVLPVR